MKLFGRLGGPEDAQWRDFSTAVIAVLGVSVLAVLAVTAAVSMVQLGGLARDEQKREAETMAIFLARRAYVPVSLEDTASLARLIDLYVDDPDVVSIEIKDARGGSMIQRRPREANRTVQATQPIRIPAEEGGLAGASAGTAVVTLSLKRVYGAVWTSFLWIFLAGLAVLALAVAVDVALILWMTRRLQVVVGEARLAEALQRSNKELEQFAFVASHDLQEPLRKIVSYCQLLQRVYKGKLDAQGEAFIEIIVKGSRRMSALIEDLLSYSRAGSQGREPRPVDSRAALDAALGVLEEALKESGGQVAVEGELPMVMADESQLEQLFQNLVGNALKFRAAPAPRVTVSAAKDGRRWRFCVKDNGIGLDPKDAEKIFEMFRRLHPRERYPGTGIGLAICKKIVERHGGRIWVESRAGQGAAFFFTLKAAGPV